MSLVTLPEVKDHLRIPVIVGDPGDPDLTQKLDAAEATILDYIGTTAYWRDVVATWTDPTAPVDPPAFVRSAILLQVGELWRFRGDDLESESPARDPNDELSPAIVALLRRTRDPVIA